MTDLPPLPPPRPAAFSLPAASWGQRAAAFLVDGCVQVLLIVAVAAAVAAITGGGSFEYTLEEDGGERTTDTFPYWAAWSLGAAAVVLLTYPWLALGLTNGRSPGRRAAGIQVVRYDGSGVGVGTAFLREGVTKGLLALFTLPLLLSYLWPLWDPRQRALHDLVCSTRVVRADAAAGVEAHPFAARDGDDLAGRIGLAG